MAEKVLVALSGGVDSSVAAAILKEQGYEIGGAMFLAHGENDSDVTDAQNVCEKLDIPFYLFDFRNEFKKMVIDPFADEYLSGKTPNPCVFCNKRIKFGTFMNKADELGYRYVATGHYARIRKNETTGRYELLKCADENKDQSYMLYHLPQNVLSRIILPLGLYTKKQIRDIAAASNLPTASKSDSQDICFIPNGNHADFIESLRPDVCKDGNFVTDTDEILGPHGGIYRYTIGQRKGLGISLGKPAYVSDVDPENKTVKLVTDEQIIFKNRIILNDINVISAPQMQFDGMVKIRYSHKPCECRVDIHESTIEVKFKEPQRAPTLGQAAVVYLNDAVVCGGTIMKVL